MRLLLPLCCCLMIACDAGTQEENATSASADTAPPAPTTASADTSALETLDCGAFMERALRVRPTRAELREVFGAPDSVRAWTEPNRHVPDVTDSLFVVRYPGLDVEIRRPYGGLDMADLARVSDNRYLARAGIGVGAPAERIIAVLGEPQERSGTQLRYECGETSAPITFALANEAVQSVELDYYVD